MGGVSFGANAKAPNMLQKIWIFQNIMHPTIPFGLEFEETCHSGFVVVYLKLGRPNTEQIRALEAQGSKVFLYHVRDEVDLNYDLASYLAYSLLVRPQYDARSFAIRLSRPGQSVCLSGSSRASARAAQKLCARHAGTDFSPSSSAGWTTATSPLAKGRSSTRWPGAIRATPCRTPPMRGTAGGGLVSTPRRWSMRSSRHVLTATGPKPSASKTCLSWAASTSACTPSLVEPAALANPLFPGMNDWEELPSLMDRMRGRLADQPKALNELQAACVERWGMVKRGLAPRIAACLPALRRR